MTTKKAGKIVEMLLENKTSLKEDLEKPENNWGSATEKGTVNLNSNLLKAPKDVIDYIIIHELCHLKIKNHSFRYWNLVRKFMPNYVEKKDWLEKNSKMILN